MWRRRIAKGEKKKSKSANKGLNEKGALPRSGGVVVRRQKEELGWLEVTVACQEGAQT